VLEDSVHLLTTSRRARRRVCANACTRVGR